MQIQCVVCGRLWTPVLMRLVSRMIHMTRQHQTGGMQNCTHEHLNMMHDTSWNEHAVHLFITTNAEEYLFIICFLRSRVEVFYTTFSGPNCMQAQREAASSPCWQHAMRQTHQPGESDEGAWR